MSISAYGRIHVRTRSHALAGSLLLIIFAAACGGDSERPFGPEPGPEATGDVDRDGIPDDQDLCPTQAETPNKVFDTDGCPDTPMDLYLFARGDIEAYWGEVFANSGFQYPPIRIFHFYEQQWQSACGALGPNNAFYCPVDVGTYYHAPFMALQLEHGDYAPVFVISHELGHHVQTVLGFVGPGLSTKQRELQADCLGGAYAQSAGERGILETGDLDEAILALFRVGDPDIPWFDPSGHGTAGQRIDAFGIGNTRGPGACTDGSFFERFPF